MKNPPTNKIDPKRLLAVKERVTRNFTLEHWQDLTLLTDSDKIINGHGRLLRSLGFGDPDYGGHVVSVLQQILAASPENIDIIETYLDQKFGGGGTFVSAVDTTRRITFAPNVFTVSNSAPREDLVAVMMPFNTDFKPVYAAIKAACESATSANGGAVECLRGDDIWRESTFIQDIFNLIYEAKIVVCDFSERNPNVMYETGIAHTLGKHVVPIAQSKIDIPSDVQHHRYLLYLNNAEGLEKFTQELGQRIQTIFDK